MSHAGTTSASTFDFSRITEVGTRLLAISHAVATVLQKKLPFDNSNVEIEGLPDLAPLKGSDIILEYMLINLAPAEAEIRTTVSAPFSALLLAAPFIEPADAWWAWINVLRVELLAVAELFEHHSSMKAQALRELAAKLQTTERTAVHSATTFFAKSRNPLARMLGFGLAASQRASDTERSLRGAHDRESKLQTELIKVTDKCGRRTFIVWILSVALFTMTGAFIIAVAMR